MRNDRFVVVDVGIDIYQKGIFSAYSSSLVIVICVTRSWYEADHHHHHQLTVPAVLSDYLTLIAPWRKWEVTIISTPEFYYNICLHSWGH